MARKIRRTNRKNSKRLNSRRFNSKRRSKVVNRRNTLKRRNTMKRRNTKYYKVRRGGKDPIHKMMENKAMIEYAKTGHVDSARTLLTAALTGKTWDTRENIITKLKERLSNIYKDLEFSLEDRLNINYEETNKDIYGFLDAEQAAKVTHHLLLNPTDSTFDNLGVKKAWLGVKVESFKPY